MALSSFLVLRQTPVAPTDHADQLAELRPLVQGQKVLFLGRDNFVVYELRGARPFTAVRNYYDPNYVKPDLRLKDVFRKFDFDSVTPATLSSLPLRDHDPRRLRERPAARLRARPRDLGLRALEADGPGRARGAPCRRAPIQARSLDCSSPARRRSCQRRGSATVFAAPPVVGGTLVAELHRRGRVSVTQTLTLPGGRWEISLQYDATRRCASPPPGLDATLPANLDYRGSVPYYPVGELAVRHERPGPVHRQRRAPAHCAGRLLGTKSQAHLGAIAASPAGAGGPIPGEAERRVPLRPRLRPLRRLVSPTASAAEPNISLA